MVDMWYLCCVRMPGTTAGATIRPTVLQGKHNNSSSLTVTPKEMKNSKKRQLSEIFSPIQHLQSDDLEWEDQKVEDVVNIWQPAPTNESSFDESLS
mmetsp:Transcript_35441/g.68447  ORF Transcript_35441/g.68447 Transcript_35441/m.68447 type:complete len:96 (-) Transcript_35441:11-298(-)